MNTFARNFKWILVAGVLAANLVVGARLYSQETAAAEEKSGED